MRRGFLVPWVITVGGCSGDAITSGPRIHPNPPHPLTSIAVRPGGAAVEGTELACVGSWPTAVTPCTTAPGGADAPFTYAEVDGPDVLVLLSRRPAPVDGDAAVAGIALAFDPDGHVSGAGAAVNTYLGDERDPITGFVAPVVTSPTGQGRNAGRFELDFSWGSIAGTYDTGERPVPWPADDGPSADGGR